MLNLILIIGFYLLVSGATPFYCPVKLRFCVRSNSCIVVRFRPIFAHKIKEYVLLDKYIKIEKFAITITLLSALIVLLLSLATQVTLSNQNRALQDLQNDSVAISLENQNLEQEVQELSRYDRIIEIAKELGLEMNEANVRNVTR